MPSNFLILFLITNMAAGYTKEFLVEAFASRYISLGLDVYENLVKMANKFYDEAGKDKFREYACLDAEAIRTFKNSDLYKSMI